MLRFLLASATVWFQRASEKLDVYTQRLPWSCEVWELISLRSARCPAGLVWPQHHTHPSHPPPDARSVHRHAHMGKSQPCLGKEEDKPPPPGAQLALRACSRGEAGSWGQHAAAPARRARGRCSAWVQAMPCTPQPASPLRSHSHTHTQHAAGSPHAQSCLQPKPPPRRGRATTKTPPPSTYEPGVL